jgi:ATPase family associated with various cellular activities (AAA)
MKGATEVAGTAGRASRPGVRLTAQDMAQVRTIAATLRTGSGRKPLVLSGRGATMAADAIARELRLDLFPVDLSAVISKFIGETEKNLARLFDATEASGAILLFDEADALFGRRTEVSDAHDRFSNAEINSLLRGLERGHGLVFLVSRITTALPMKWRRQFALQRFPPADFR